MKTMIGPPADRIINRLDDLTADLGARANQRVRPAGLTSRDVDAEVLARLALKGFDWSGTFRRRRRAT